MVQYTYVRSKADEMTQHKQESSGSAGDGIIETLGVLVERELQ